MDALPAQESMNREFLRDQSTVLRSSPSCQIIQLQIVTDCSRMIPSRPCPIPWLSRNTLLLVQEHYYYTKYLLTVPIWLFSYPIYYLYSLLITGSHQIKVYDKRIETGFFQRNVKSRIPVNSWRIILIIAFQFCNLNAVNITAIEYKNCKWNYEQFVKLHFLYSH